MRFAFSTSIRPNWPLAEVTLAARDLGYTGIEVYLPRASADGDPAEGTPVAERDLVRLGCEQAGIQLAGLAVDTYLTLDSKADELAMSALRAGIDLAARLRCDYLRFAGALVPNTMSVASAAMTLGHQLQALADHASVAGVSLLIQNSCSFRRASEMWRVIEQADHPSLAVAWDPVAAAQIGESPALAVPVLNSRIRQVMLTDAVFGAPGVDALAVSPRSFGEGCLQTRKLIDRLRGIGFDAWAVVTYPQSQTLGQVETVLSQAMNQINAWKPVIKSRPARREVIASK